jgi:hypothetical protein
MTPLLLIAALLLLGVLLSLADHYCPDKHCGICCDRLTDEYGFPCPNCCKGETL